MKHKAIWIGILMIFLIISLVIAQLDQEKDIPTQITPKIPLKSDSALGNYLSFISGVLLLLGLAIIVVFIINNFLGRKIEFFRLTKGKIILGILLFLIFPWKYSGGCLAVIGYNCPKWTFGGGFSLLADFIALVEHLNMFVYAFKLWPSIILILIVSYLLSCLIVLSYNKIKVRKRK